MTGEKRARRLSLRAAKRRRKDGNTPTGSGQAPFTERRTQRSQRTEKRKREDNAETLRTQRFAEKRKARTGLKTGHYRENAKAR